MDLLFGYIILFKYLLNTDNKELSKKLCDLDGLCKGNKYKENYYKP